jgi:hypothetical protein
VCGHYFHAQPDDCPVDTSQEQQDVAKDFLIGSRAAWQDINLKGGLRGFKSIIQQ